MDAWTVPGYTDSRELGSGTSGRVVLAAHDATGVPVAIKYLAARIRSDHSFVLGLRAEARLLGGLGSAHVVRLYEYVESPHGAAIVMELVDGIALRALLREEGATGAEAALAVLKGSLLGLADAHRAGVVHRDYKPENVLVATDGSSKLVDFGIAVGRGTEPEVAGTPSYMAPEQWQGGTASPSTDVYAATATFFECLTGHKPYTADNFAELALAHMEAPVPDEEAPEPLRPLIRRGLAKDPAERPGSAAAFLAELEGIAERAYGPAWEERGQHRLAALVALLPLLLPSAEGESWSTADAATTAIGPSPRRPGSRWLGPFARIAVRGRKEDGGRAPAGAAARGTAVGAAAVTAATATGGTAAAAAAPTARREALWTAGILCAAAAAAAGLFAVAVAAEPDGDGGATAAGRHLATTSARPTGPSPSLSPRPSRSGTSSPSPSPSPQTSSASPSSGSPSATGPDRGGPRKSEPTRPGAPRPTLSPSVGPPPGPRPTAPRPSATPTSSSPRPTPSATQPVPARVRSVEVTGLEQPGSKAPGSAATATVEVTTDGTGPVTLVLTWYTGEAPGELGQADGVETLTRSGARTYTLTLTHVFERDGCYLSALVSANPAPVGGDASRQILDRRCASSDESQPPA